MHLEYSLCGNHMIPHDPIDQEKNYGTLQIDDEIVTDDNSGFFPKTRLDYSSRKND
ncbi:MAG: hypothetical protein QGH04_05885 [Candidatus Marinimicrobia bacterium]|nr:hypothetical protein [Candidatus Neomarinimicrobiota bacterium]